MKPENILLTELGRAKIADFGIARTGSGQKLTEHGGVIGTIDYVSPEYMLNSHVDWRSDIYALGILAYEMVTGEAPFRGESVYATMMKRLKTEPKSPSSLRSECPEELERIVQKAMARSLEDRYQSARAMHEDLVSFQRHYVSDVLRCANSDDESLRLKQTPPVATVNTSRKVNRKRAHEQNLRVRVRDILPSDRHESGLERRTSMVEGAEVSSLFSLPSDEERGSLVSNRAWRSPTNASGITLLKKHSDSLIRPQTGKTRTTSSIMAVIFMKSLLLVLSVLLGLSLAAVFFCGIVSPVECRQFLLGKFVPWRISLSFDMPSGGDSSLTLAYPHECAGNLFPKLSTTTECSSIRTTNISKRFFA
jgi:serine/threonine protein kinase